MADAFFLSESDRKILKGVIADVEQLRINFPGRSSLEEVDYQTPETYIAWPPSGGIPALTTVGDLGPSGGGDQPGSAECDIYLIDHVAGTPDLNAVADFSATVYNLSEIKVPRAWCLVQRTKFGNWVVTWAPQQARKLRFAVNDGSGFAVTDASVAVDTVTYHDGVDPASAITTVYNEVADTNYIFNGADDARGKAEYFPDDDKYYIYQMECP